MGYAEPMKRGSSREPPPELQSGKDMLAWKREYNIRQRDADWKRRQDELLTRKQVAWEIESCERDNRLSSAGESRRRMELEGRVCQQHIEVDRRYKERCRDAEIERRAKVWEDSENERLIAMHREAKESTLQRQEARAAEKARACEEMRIAATERAEKRLRAAALNEQREENIRRREAERQAGGAENARQLKADPTAASQALVTAFAERTVPAESTIAGLVTQRAVDPQYSHFGASAGGIL